MTGTGAWALARVGHWPRLGRSHRVDGAVVGRPNQRSAWRSHHRCGCEAAGASNASRFGEIAPAFAAALNAGST